jgi:integrase
VLQRIGTVLLWAKGNGHISTSPTDEIEAARKALPKQSDKPKHHESLHYKDLPQFFTSLREHSVSEPIRLAFEFLILTAARTSEVLQAKWAEINWDEGTWIIPATRMKAKREHRVPLSTRCVEILQLARPINEDLSGFLFPGTISGKSISNMAFLMTLRRMGMTITAHGFRSTFRVWCAERTQFPREVAEAALAHIVKDATEAAYMRSTFLEQRRGLMERWANYATTEVTLIGIAESSR